MLVLDEIKLGKSLWKVKNLHIHIKGSLAPFLFLEVSSLYTTLPNANVVCPENATCLKSEEMANDFISITIEGSSLGRLIAFERHEIVISRCTFYGEQNSQRNVILSIAHSNLIVNNTSFPGFHTNTSLIMVQNGGNVTFQNTNFIGNEYTKVSLVSVSMTDYVHFENVTFDDNLGVSSFGKTIRRFMVCLNANFVKVANSAFISNTVIPGVILRVIYSNLLSIQGTSFINNSANVTTAMAFINDTVHVSNNSYISNRANIIEIAHSQQHYFCGNILHKNIAFQRLILYQFIKNVQESSNSYISNMGYPFIIYQFIKMATFSTNNYTDNKAQEDHGRMGLLILQNYLHITIFGCQFYNNSFKVLIHNGNDNSTLMAKLHVLNVNFVFNRGILVDTVGKFKAKVVGSLINQNMQQSGGHGQELLIYIHRSILDIEHCSFFNNSGGLINVDHAVLNVRSTLYHSNEGTNMILSRYSNVSIQVTNYTGNSGYFLIISSWMALDSIIFQHHYNDAGVVFSLNSEVFIVNCLFQRNCWIDYFCKGK